MEIRPLSSRIQPIYDTITPLIRFATESAWAHHKPSSETCDFALGNPHEMPLPGYVDTLQEAIVPQNKDWFAYKRSEPEAQLAISASLSQRLGHQFNEDDVCLTSGAFAGLHVVINTIVDAGDEVIFITPHWFFYEGMIISAGGTAVKVGVNSDSFDLDLDAIKGAISTRTRAIIINSPHNPTGKIYGRDTLVELGRILEEASAKNGRTVYLISDEAYHQIIYDGNKFISPATIYPNTFLIYTYGKVHLTPGQRIGFIALPPQMPDRDDIRNALNVMQMFSGWAFPNAILQYAITELIQLSIDISQLQARRDRLISALTEIGYETNHPEGTFYLLVKSPIENEWAFVEQLAQRQVFCLPGSACGLPGFFRISLTGNDEMVKRSIPRFAEVFRLTAESHLKPVYAYELSGL